MKQIDLEGCEGLCIGPQGADSCSQPVTSKSFLFDVMLSSAGQAGLLPHGALPLRPVIIFYIVLVLHAQNLAHHSRCAWSWCCQLMVSYADPYNTIHGTLTHVHKV